MNIFKGVKSIKTIIFLILFTLISFSCSENKTERETFQTQQRSENDFEITLWGIGVGRTKEASELSALTLIAQQKEGIRFSYSKNGIAFNTKDSEIRGAKLVSSWSLSDGRKLAIMNADAKIKLKKVRNKRIFISNVKLMDFINNREDVLMDILSQIYKKRIMKGETINGLIYISGIENIDIKDKLNENFKLKIMLLD